MNLHEACTPQSLAAAFARHGAFPFPAAALPATPAASRRLAAVVAAARDQLGKPWPALPVTLYLRYYRDGNRSAYERPYFDRRRRLGAAALAWVATHEAGFAADFADGVGLVCDESTWCVPAHLSHGMANELASRLPGPGSTGFIDLFNSETGMVLAEACQFAGAALDGIDSRIQERVREEIRRRLLDPILSGITTWWMQGSNNWSVWCASSLLTAAGFALAGDPPAWGRLAHRMLRVLDRYVEKQAPDGGCDEGVMYWSVAGGNVGKFLEELRLRTGGEIDGWGADARVREIMRFPGRMHLGGGTFPCFADGGPRPGLPGGVLAAAASRLAAPELLSLARLLNPPEPKITIEGGGVGDLLPTQLRALYWFDTAAEPPALVTADQWLPDLHVVVAHGGDTALVAKGGHNEENHNHNDVGQFVIHRHGVPLLVDAGRGNYTAQTFGPKRYELWWTRGAGHAVPQIDGHEQFAGREQAARSVACRLAADRAEFSLDLAAAYAAAAGLRRLQRSLVLDRSSGAVRLTDRIEAGREVAYALPLLLTAEPRPDGERAWVVESAGQRVRILADPGLVGTVEAAEMDDGLRASWGALWRLTLRGRLADGAEAGVSVTPS